jgi:hypothetical protein
MKSILLIGAQAADVGVLSVAARQGLFAQRADQRLVVPDAPSGFGAHYHALYLCCRRGPARAPISTAAIEGGGSGEARRTSSS